MVVIIIITIITFCLELQTHEGQPTNKQTIKLFKFFHLGLVKAID